MMSVQQLEDVAREWQRDWEKELKERQLLSRIVREAPVWQRWSGRAMKGIGAYLLRSGEQLEQPRCQECIAGAD